MGVDELQAELPACHAKGTDAAGYDADEQDCLVCPDKFTCLPASHELTGCGIGDDSEVAAVVEGTSTVAEMIERMRRRLKLIKAGQDVPITLSTRGPVKEPLPTPTMLPPKPVDLPQAFPDSPEASGVRAKPAPPAVAVKRKLKRRKQSSVLPNGRKKPGRKPGPPRVPPLGENGELLPPTERDCLPDGKPLPEPRTVAWEQMTLLLSGGGGGKLGVRINCPMPLKVGMTLVRRKRDGTSVSVKLRRDGFEQNGAVYASLSSAAIASEKRIVSGNDFFDMSKRMGVEVLDQHGNVLVRSASAGGLR